MKKILMIGTGGTIASEMTPEGLTPELNTHQLLSYLPRIAQLCHVDCIQLYSLDSTSIHPTHWLGTAQAIREHYDDYDGFVISHGTDTMAYTAAALSYLVQDSPKPIILTGAQKPIWFDGTDSKRNLTDAFLYACRGCGGVQIVFNGRVILGTRARKTYSKSFRAFSSVNYPDLAVVQDEHLLQYIRCESRPRPLFYDRLDPHVGLLKLIPGTEDALAEFMLDRYDGLIIESFGVGGLPEYDADTSTTWCAVGWSGARCGHDHAGPQRGQRPDGIPCGGTPEEHPPAAGGLRHDHRGRRGQAHVDHGADP